MSLRLKSSPLFAAFILVLALLGPAHAFAQNSDNAKDPESDSISLVDKEGNKLLVQTSSQESGLKQAKDAMIEIGQSFDPEHTEINIVTDDPDAMKPVIEETAKLSGRFNPSLYLLKSKDLSDKVKGGVYSGAAATKKSGGKFIQAIRSTDKMTIVFFFTQMGVQTYFWVFGSHDASLTSRVVAAVFSTGMTLVFTARPHMWRNGMAKGAEKIGNWAQKVFPKLDRESKAFFVTSYFLSSYLGNTIVSGFYKGIVSPESFTSLTGAEFFLALTLFQGVVNTGLGTFDANMAYWTRFWNNRKAETGQEPTLSSTEVGNMMRIRGTIMSAVMPFVYQAIRITKNLPSDGVTYSWHLGTNAVLLFSANHPVALSIAGGVAALGGFLIWKGESAYTWLESQAWYVNTKVFTDLAMKGLSDAFDAAYREKHGPRSDDKTFEDQKDWSFECGGLLAD